MTVKTIKIKTYYNNRKHRDIIVGRCVFLFEAKSTEPILSLRAHERTVVTTSAELLTVWNYSDGIVLILLQLIWFSRFSEHRIRNLKTNRKENEQSRANRVDKYDILPLP